MIGEKLSFIMIYTTLPDEAVTKKISRILVEENLVACVNFFSIRSVYKWENKLNEDQEYALIMKTRTYLYKDVEKKLKELHPYKVPAIVCYEIKNGLKDYLSWIKEETKME